MNVSTTRSFYFDTLDLLRGFAAISVLLFHIGHWLNFPILATNSNLAVDLFYCLSGFVLSSAYAGVRFHMTLGDFVLRRLVRLMPLIVLGTLVSAGYVVMRAYLPNSQSHVANEPLSPGVLITAVLLGIANCPYFNAPHVIGGPELFPLNGPQYTLFFEVVVNVLWWMSRKLPQALTAGVAVAVFAPISVYLGLGGANAENFLSGFPRVIMCFELGVLCYCVEKMIPSDLDCTFLFAGCLFAMLFLFYYPVEISYPLHFFFVVFLSPVVVLAGSRTKSGLAWKHLSVVSGTLSYPLYVLHYPIFVWLNGIYRSKFGAQNIIFEGPLIVFGVIFISSTVLKIYDIPCRARLNALIINLRIGSRSKIKGYLSDALIVTPRSKDI